MKLRTLILLFGFFTAGEQTFAGMTDMVSSVADLFTGALNETHHFGHNGAMLLQDESTKLADQMDGIPMFKEAAMAAIKGINATHNMTHNMFVLAQDAAATFASAAIGLTNMLSGEGSWSVNEKPKNAKSVNKVVHSHDAKKTVAVTDDGFDSYDSGSLSMKRKASCREISCQGVEHVHPIPGSEHVAFVSKSSPNEVQIFDGETQKIVKKIVLPKTPIEKVPIESLTCGKDECTVISRRIDNYWKRKTYKLADLPTVAPEEPNVASPPPPPTTPSDEEVCLCPMAIQGDDGKKAVARTESTTKSLNKATSTYTITFEEKPSKVATDYDIISQGEVIDTVPGETQIIKKQVVTEPFVGLSSMKFNSDGSLCVVKSAEEIIVFSAKTGQVVNRIKDAEAKKPSFSPDSKYITTTSKKTVTMYKTKSKKPFAKMEVPDCEECLLGSSVGFSEEYKKPFIAAQTKGGLFKAAPCDEEGGDVDPIPSLPTC